MLTLRPLLESFKEDFKNGMYTVFAWIIISVGTIFILFQESWRILKDTHSLLKRIWFRRHLKKFFKEGKLYVYKDHDIFEIYSLTQCMIFLEFRFTNKLTQQDLALFLSKEKVISVSMRPEFVKNIFLLDDLVQETDKKK